jgi:NAD(P)-dependent dehydrogenase (short-subunit alcohol dehydrogenase family)
VLVNNAGVAGMNKPTVDYPIEEWERVLRINLTSQFLCCRAVAPLMVKGKYGRIVNIASDRRQGRQPERRGVLGFQGRRHLIDQEPRKRARANRCAGELRDAGGGEDRDLRPDDAAAHRLHAVQDPDEPLRQRRRGGVAGVLAGERGLQLFHGGGVFDISGGRATY